MGNADILTGIIGDNSLISGTDKDTEKLKPSLFGRKLLFEHRVTVRTAGEGSAEKEYRSVKG